MSLNLAILIMEEKHHQACFSSEPASGRAEMGRQELCCGQPQAA
jgi:hypothetical protein